MADGHTYDFLGLDVRDLSELMADIMSADNLGFLNIFGEGPAPTNVKHEWSQDSIQSLAGQLNAAHLAGDTNLTVVDSSVFSVGDIITAVTPTGVSSLERMRVTVIVDPTTITVVRAIGSAAAALVDQSALKIVARPKFENNKTLSPTTTNPNTDYNYTQIFERSVDISRTAGQVRHYAMGNDPLAYNEMLRMREILRELNRSLIWGVREAGDKSATQRRMGGLLEFAEKVPLGASLDNPSQINDVSEEIVREGGSATALVCNTDMARRISNFNVGSLNTTLADRNAGSFVSRFVGDTPLSGIQTIVVDIDFPRDMVAVCDQSRLEINPLLMFSSLPATAPGQDGTSRVIRGEYTSTWRNAFKVQKVITQITLP